MESKLLGLIGGGRITRIILRGLSNRKALPDSVKVYEPNAETVNALRAEFPGIVITDSAVSTAEQEIIFIAAHPPVVVETLMAIKEYVTEKTMVISLAPKFTLGKMASLFPIKKVGQDDSKCHVSH